MAPFIGPPQLNSPIYRDSRAVCTPPSILKTLQTISPIVADLAADDENAVTRSEAGAAAGIAPTGLYYTPKMDGGFGYLRLLLYLVLQAQGLKPSVVAIQQTRGQ